MEERARRILDTAVRLAERGGFEGVRLRDVAAEANVALATVYKRFRSKEDILLAVLEGLAEDFDLVADSVARLGKTPEERLLNFFHHVTRWMCAKPELARALLRAVSSGDKTLSEKVLRYHTRTTQLINRALAGDGKNGSSSGSPGLATLPTTLPTTLIDERLGFLFQQVWFASMVGWMGGLHTEADVMDHMRYAADRLLPSGSR
jgi:AcrR family transcriptional regulator